MATWLSRPSIASSPVLFERPRVVAALDFQHMDEADRLFAPLLVDGRAHCPPHRLGGGVGIAPACAWQSLEGRDDGIEYDVVDLLARRILLGDADHVHFGIIGQLAL